MGISKIDAVLAFPWGCVGAWNRIHLLQVWIYVWIYESAWNWVLKWNESGGLRCGELGPVLIGDGFGLSDAVIEVVAQLIGECVRPLTIGTCIFASTATAFIDVTLQD